VSFLSQFSERTASRRGLSLVSIVGIVLVPFVIAGILVWALWNPQDRLDRMTAAIVNDDKPVTLNGQTVPLGRELSAGLVGTAKPGSAKAGKNFAWVITDKADAADGLASGKYSAVITIPKDFSAAATSTANAADARTATIRLQTAASSKVLDQTISQTIAQTAASTLGQQLTASYVENLLAGFGTLGGQLGDASSGAQQLAAQGPQLASGAQQAAAGQQQLASGQQQLANGLTPLASGASGVAGGAQQLSTGLGQLDAQLAQLQQAAASGAMTGPQLAAALAQLQGGVGQLQGGAGQLASGASALASGAKQSAAAAQQLATGSAQAASGASSLADGVQQYTDGTTQLANGVSTAATSIPSYTDAERTALSKIVANPVVVQQAPSAGFGALAAPIFGVLALWLGALACFIVLRPVAVTALGSPRSSMTVALRGLVLPGVIGAIQGVAVAAVLQPMLQLGVGPWFGLAGIGALAGVAFAAVNQALVALFGGTGRFISMLVILLGLATGLVGTAPQFMSTLASFTPIGPAQRLVEAVVQGTAVSGGSIVELALWLLGAVLVTTLAVARGRVVPASRLAPAPASAQASMPEPA
jgi:putative membrane protein